MMRNLNDYHVRRLMLMAMLSAAIAISGLLAGTADAQNRRYPDNQYYYDNHGDIYARHYLNRGPIRDEYNPYQLPLKDGGYLVKAIKESPSSYGAKTRYLDDNWEKGYMFWAPPSFNKQKMRPLVISLHGNSEAMEDAFARFYYPVLQYNYAFAAPKWIYGGKAMAPEELTELIVKIIAELQTKEGINVDINRVILHGYERGAGMAGYLKYYTPDKYIMVVIDSGVFPDVGSDRSSEDSLIIPSNDLHRLYGSYIYLYSRHEDQAIYGKLEETKNVLVAAGVNAELNYTKGLLPGGFSRSLSKSVVDMFDTANGGK